MARTDQKPAEIKKALVAEIDFSRSELQREWDRCRAHWAPHRILQRSMKSHLGWWLGGATLGGLKLAGAIMPSKKSQKLTREKKRPLRSVGKFALLLLKPTLRKMAQRQVSLWLSTRR